MSEHRKGIMLGAGIAVLGVIGLFAIANLLGPSGSFVSGSSNPGGQPHPVLVSAFSCSARNQSCQIILSNSVESQEQAVGCAFETIYSGNVTNANRISTAGVLSNQPGGPATSISIEGRSSATVYCAPVDYPAYALQPGKPVGGEISFSNETLIAAGFAGTWK
jgi:hypothetical protein